MFLECVHIGGFRGIQKLVLPLNKNSVLIGENSWGKSTLLDALSIFLSAQSETYQLQKSDFYQSKEEETQTKTLEIIFTFSEIKKKRHKSIRFEGLRPVFTQSDDGLHRIRYQITGTWAADGSILTHRHFLNSCGKEMDLDTSRYLQELIRLSPVIRLRDARFISKIHADFIHNEGSDERRLFNEKLTHLTHALVDHPEQLSDDELVEGVKTMQQLLSHYFSEQSPHLFNRDNPLKHRLKPRQRGWKALNHLNQMASQINQRKIRLILLGFFSSILQSKTGVPIDKYARPILIMEDPETRLHPIMLSILWDLLNLLTLQRITTTNASDLLDKVPLENLCRLVSNAHHVETYQLEKKQLSAEEMRKITFHIRFSHASALFARRWLLVEGETEVWLMSELAKQCALSFPAEGVKVVQFAQCGLKPLLKFAHSLGIQWHVLVDGDEAGKKYADTARHFAQQQGVSESSSLTLLPEQDIESFLYHNGLSEVYRQHAALTPDLSLSPRAVIDRAIHHSSKPDLAIAIAEYTLEHGTQSIPPLLKQLFFKVIALTELYD